MSGYIPVGEIDAAGDVTTGALIGTQHSRSQAAVDDRITALGPTLVGFTPSVVAAAEAAVTTAIAGRDLVWSRGSLAPGTDLDAITVDGVYRIETYGAANSLVNGPGLVSAVNAAVLEVFTARISTGILVQRWITVAGSVFPTLERTRASTGVWSEWRRTDDIQAATYTTLMNEIRVAAWLKSALTAGTDLDAITVDGVYRIGTYGAASSMVNRPTLKAAVNPAVLEVVTLANGAAQQTWTTLPAVGVDAPILTRRRDNGGSWSQWERTDTTEAVSPLVGAAIAVEADRQTRNRVLGMSIPNPRPLWAYSGPAAQAPLTMPTHDGSGSVTHPSILHFPDGWGGFEYWMAFTPYPNGNEAHEDPNIVASHDGETWVVPDGLTNPLDDQEGRPDPYNSDTCLAVGPTGGLICLWRTVDRPNSSQEIYYARSSADGVNWTPKWEWLKNPLGTQDSSVVAPAIIWVGDKWRMYAISTNRSPNQLVYWETTAPNPTTSDWGAPTVCDTGVIPPSRDWWHIDIRRHGDGWLGLMNDVTRGTAGVDGRLYLMESADGLTWDVSSLPLIPQIGEQHDSLYKSTFLPSGGRETLTLDLFYAAFDKRNRDHRLFRTTVTPIPRVAS